LLERYLGNSAESYDVRAGKDFTYFHLENYDELMAKEGEKFVRAVNFQFLDEQIDGGKEIFLSHDPMKATGAFGEEINHLKSRGFTNFKQIANDLWQAIRE